jgi:hypothetical protein
MDVVQVLVLPAREPADVAHVAVPHLHHVLPSTRTRSPHYRPPARRGEYP